MSQADYHHYGDEHESKYEAARSAVRANNPPIEVNQRWVAFNARGEVFRKLRILAPHPDGGWITIDEPSIMTRQRPLFDYRIGCTPEFNLRYVFQLEVSDD